MVSFFAIMLVNSTNGIVPLIIYRQYAQQVALVFGIVFFQVQPQPVNGAQTYDTELVFLVEFYLVFKLVIVICGQERQL